MSRSWVRERYGGDESARKTTADGGMVMAING